MTIVPTLRRLRQESCHKTQLSSVPWSLSQKERKEPARFLGTPGGAAQHSSRGCCELPGLTGTLKQATHPTRSRQSWLSTSKYHTLHLYQPQLWSCQLPSMGLLRHTDSLPDGRGRPCEFTSRLTAGLCHQVQDFPKHTTVKCFLSLF